MRKRTQILIVILLALLSANVAFLNIRMDKRRDEYLSQRVDLLELAQYSNENDLYFCSVAEKLREALALQDSARTGLKEKLIEHVNAVPNIVKATNPSVVRIELPRREYNRMTGEEEIRWGGGAGVVLDNEGHILTAAHITRRWDNLDPSLPSPRIRTYDGRTWDVLMVPFLKEE